MQHPSLYFSEPAPKLSAGFPSCCTRDPFRTPLRQSRHRRQNMVSATYPRTPPPAIQIRSVHDASDTTPATCSCNYHPWQPTSPDPDTCPLRGSLQTTCKPRTHDPDTRHLPQLQMHCRPYSCYGSGWTGRCIPGPRVPCPLPGVPGSNAVQPCYGLLSENPRDVF